MTYNPEEQKCNTNELFNNADGNDDILSDIDDGDNIRHGMWAITPYSVEDGTGVVNEVYDRKLADEIAPLIAEKFNLTLQYIDSGENGVAYDAGNGKVLKITGDKSEAVENLKLIGKKLNYIAQPYVVLKITSKNKQMPETYAIILEKLQTNVNEFERLIDRMNFAFKKILGIDYYDVILHYTDQPDFSVDDDKVNAYLKKNPQDAEFFYGIVRIAEELKKYDIESVDYINPKNLGYKPSGALAFFDVGFGSDVHTQGSVPKEMEIDEDGSSKFSQTDSIGRDDFPSYDQNDTSPSIQNDLNANSAMYNEDLEYNHASDATQDEYEIDERVLSSMKGSSTVNVKKKCRLGGLGNTSAPCNQGDIGNLEINSLDEDNFPTNNTFWGWVSPKNEFYEVPMMEHLQFLEKLYPNAVEEQGDLYEKAYRDGWVRVLYNNYEGKKNPYSGSDTNELSLAGSNGRRVKSVVKNVFHDLVNRGNVYIYMDYSNGKSDRIIADNPEGKMELYDYLREEENINLNEEIDASEGYRNETSIQAMIDGNKRVAFVQLNPNLMKIVEVEGFGLIKIDQDYHNVNSYIVYKNDPISKERAMKLYGIAKTHGGYLSDKTPEEAWEIGKLLDYSESSIKKFIKERYVDKVDFYGRKFPEDRFPKDMVVDPKYYMNEDDEPENKIQFTDDTLLNTFLNKLNQKEQLLRNPFLRRELMYGEKGSLEFSRFNKENTNEIELSDIVAYEKSQGVGSSMMKDIVDVADEMNVKLTLTAKPFGNDPNGLKLFPLINFYKNFGFQADLSIFDGEFEAEDEYFDYVREYPDEGFDMYREPKRMNEMINEGEIIKNNIKEARLLM